MWLSEGVCTRPGCRLLIFKRSLDELIPKLPPASELFQQDKPSTDRCPSVSSFIRKDHRVKHAVSTLSSTCPRRLPFLWKVQCSMFRKDRNVAEKTIKCLTGSLCFCHICFSKLHRPSLALLQCEIGVKNVTDFRAPGWLSQ